MKNFRRKNAKKVSAILATLALTGVMASGTAFTAFAADIRHTDANSASQSKGGIFYTDYSSPEDLMDAAKQLAEEISNEGMVLMQNNNNALPLRQGARLSVFGKSSVNPAYGGGGSGALVGVTPVSLYDGLKNAGFKTNGILEAFYNNNALSGTGRSDKTYVNETPVESYTRAVTDSYQAYDDAAVIVITRTGAEGSDLTRTGNAKDNVVTDEGTTITRYLSVTPAEIELVEHAREHFNKVIVLVNSSNTVELTAIKDKVDSILWVGNPGERGFNSVGKILNGEVNPSGRLSDTYVSDLTLDPTWANFGNNSQNTGVQVVTKSGNSYRLETILYNALHETGETVPAGTTIKVNNVDTDISGRKVYEKGGTYTEYEEGIYVGYRYYETRAHEMGTNGAEWYNNTVDFAFGEGLSYANFKWTLKDHTDTLTKNGKITVKVEVENTGSYAGKEVVQLYYSAPYYTDGIEKSHVNLGAYAKTDLLQPGETTTVTLEMAVQDMASFDWNDANGNGFKGYELEAGTYNFYVGTGSHCWADETPMTFNATVAASSEDISKATATGKGENGWSYTTDKDTGNDIKVLFSNNDIYNSNLGQTENKLKRSSFATASITENIIGEKTVEDFTLNEQGWKLIGSTSHIFSSADDAGDFYAYEGEEHAPWYLETAPEGWTQAGDHDAPADREEATYKFADMAGWDYDDERWETVLNELTWTELKNIVYTTGFRNAAVEYIGKDMALDNDGPMQAKLNQGPTEGTNDDFTGSGWPCSVIMACTWNDELAEREGVMIGNECLYLGLSGWFAPALNLHRNQYGGRIFEYYSSDPLQSGKIASAVTKGVQSKGVYVYLKHFCLNNQDTGRGSISIVVNEQAMREMYMKGFEIAVEEGGAHGLMTYYSFVGGTSIMQNYAILTDLVRNQWGFQGVTNHDYGPEGTASNICTPALTRRVGNCIGGNNVAPDANGEIYSTQDYYDAENNTVYYCLSDETAPGGSFMSPSAKPLETPVESVTHWWAMRESAKQILWTTANSNNQHNKLALNVFDSKELSAKYDIALSNITIGVANSDLGTNIVSYELHSGSLPAGLTLNSTTGAITGSPTEVGTFEFTVRMRADYWIKKDVTFTLTVDPSMTFTVDEDAAVGEEFYGIVELDNFSGYTTTFSVTNGVLPAGLELDAATGEITGIPTAGGTYNFTIHIHGVGS